MTQQDTSPDGLLFVLVGPSGAGKNTVINALRNQLDNLYQLPTATTRKMREGEQQGREHEFVTRDDFEQLIADSALFEWQVVHGELYGVPRRTVEKAIYNGQDLMADIEVLGSLALQQEYPANVVLIFIAPSDARVLEDRIRKRGGIDEAEIAIRMQRAGFEMRFAPQCDYLVINDRLEAATERVASIIEAERSRRLRRKLVASVLILKQEMVLVQSPVIDEYALPETQLHADENPEDTACQLVEATGVGEVIFHRGSTIYADEILPVHFWQRERDRLLELVYACDVMDSDAQPLPGWQWQPIDSVPLASAVCEALLRTAEAVQE